ncbi:MAG: hypothetical protein JWL68_3161 [Actinomycetia bacterium]|jgi:uncharacterized alkaline shock family protein YloU|nr:hypothetical protein [Actinomycetes bacterium]MDX6338867.1 hypothetical protein [Streptosporangiaceae bacterium]
MTASTAVLPAVARSRPGRTELGMISINDRVVEKMAARAAIEIPDAGAAASRFLGRSMAGASALGARQTSLTGLPKTSADVDGSRVILDLSISVRWPASVPEVTDAVREHVRSRVGELTGLTVTEVSISVTALVTQLPAPPRVH